MEPPTSIADQFHQPISTYALPKNRPEFSRRQHDINGETKQWRSVRQFADCLQKREDAASGTSMNKV